MRNAKYEIYWERDNYVTSDRLVEVLVFMTDDKQEMEREFKHICEKIKIKAKSDYHYARYCVHVTEIGKPFSYTIRCKNYYTPEYWKANSKICNKLGKAVICGGRCIECRPEINAETYED